MYKSNWLNRTLILCLSLIFIVTGCSSSQTSTSQETQPKQTESSDSKESKETKESTEPKVLKVALNTTPGKFDPHFAATNSELQVAQPIFNGLLRFKPGRADMDNIEGDLAEKWEVSEDYKTWTFHLHKGVQWQNGYGELTSADVKWSLERVMNPETGSPRRPTLRHVEGIETPDAHTVVITLKKSNPSFVLSLVADGTGGGAIVKKEAIEAAGKEYMVKPVGTGPFILQEYKQNEKAVLVKNKDYFRGEPKLDSVEFYIMQDPTAIEVALDKGEIHMSQGLSDQIWIDMMKTKKNLVLEVPGPDLFWGIYLNTSHKPYDDIRVRKAIAHAINIEPFVQSLGQDTAKMPNSVISSSMFGHKDIGMYEYNPEKSKQLLAEAGHPNGIKLPEFTSPTMNTFITKATYIQEELRKVGIELPVNQTDLATWYGTVVKNLNPITHTVYVAKPHAAEALYSFFYGPSSVGKKTASFNISHYDQADDLILQAEEEVDEAKAKEIYGQIQQKILDDYVVIPFAETRTVVVRSQQVDLGYELKDTMIYMYPIYEMTDLK
jgi:peptide/nickel transport system substrate-binding protein